MNLTDLNDIKKIQSDLRTPVGQDLLEFLIEACGYDQTVFEPTNRDMCLINDGKRQVVATLKSLLKLTPEQFVALVKQKEQ